MAKEIANERDRGSTFSPPDQQPEAIKLVMDQMEAMAPRFALGG